MTLLTFVTILFEKWKKKSEPDELSRTISFPLKSQRCEICSLKNEGNGKLFLEMKIKLLIYSTLYFFFSYFLVFRVRLPTSLIFSRREINVGWKSLARYQSGSLGSKVANIEVVQISLCVCTIDEINNNWIDAKYRQISFWYGAVVGHFFLGTAWSNESHANVEDSDCTVWMLLFFSMLR